MNEALSNHPNTFAAESQVCRPDCHEPPAVQPGQDPDVESHLPDPDSDGLDESKYDEAAEYWLENARTYSAASLWGRTDADDAIVRQVLRLWPSRQERLILPFLGKGHIFWPHLKSQKWSTALIGDTDSSVLQTYDTIGQQLEELLACLRSLEVAAPKVRPPFHYTGPAIGEINRVARIVRLGAWSDVNGRPKKVRPANFKAIVREVEEARIESCARLLRKVGGMSFRQEDFTETVRTATSGDFVVLRAPQLFSFDDHDRLAQCFRDAAGRGAYCLAIIPPRDDVAQLYHGYEMHNAVGPLAKKARKSRKNPNPAASQGRPVVARVAVNAHIRPWWREDD